MPQAETPIVFSSALRRLRLERAARNFAEHAFVHERVVSDVVDRLETVQRRFGRALFYGPAAPLLQASLTAECDVHEITIAGESEKFLKQQGAKAPLETAATALPGEDGGYDLVASLMSLHAENDIVGALIEARRALKPDGLFIAAFPAERSLKTLRDALRDAEAEITGGLSPRVAPFVAIKDAGGLLQRAGFALPVADTFNVRVQYQNPLRLLQDLRGMGETSALAKGPRGAIRRDVLAKALEQLADQETVFEILTMTGWVPHESQLKPLKPGSAKASMADAIRQMTESGDT